VQNNTDKHRQNWLKHLYRMTHERITKQIQDRVFFFLPMGEHCRLGSFISCEFGNKKYSLYSMNKNGIQMKEDLRKMCSGVSMSIQADCS